MNMNWLVKIINGSPDEFVHAKLVKYGVGTHSGPTVKLTFSKAKIGYKADLDQEKPFIKAYVKYAPEGSQKVKGVIICYTDRRDAFQQQPIPLDWTRSKGKGAPVFKSKLQGSIPIADLRALIDVDDPTTFFLLSLSPADGTKPWKITTKTSFPKAKPGVDEDAEEKDPVFSKGALANTPETFEHIINDLLPDFREHIGSSSKKILLKNKIVIEEILIPEDDTLSFSEKRKLAKKRGRVIRTALIDGTEFSNEYEFLA